MVSYSGGKLGQGKEAAVKYLQEHQDILIEIEAKTREKYFGLGAAKEEAKKAEAKERADAEAKAKAAAKPEHKKEEVKKPNVTEFKEIKAKVINDKAVNG